MLKSYVDKKVNVLKDAVKDLDKKMKHMKMRITSTSLMEGPLSNQNSPPKQTERSSPQAQVPIENERNHET